MAFGQRQQSGAILGHWCSQSPSESGSEWMEGTSLSHDALQLPQLCPTDQQNKPPFLLVDPILKSLFWQIALTNLCVNVLEVATPVSHTNSQHVDMLGDVYSLRGLRREQINSDSCATLGFCTGFCVQDYNRKSGLCVAKRSTEERMEGKGGEQRAINLARREASDRETIVPHFHVFSFCTLLSDETLTTTENTQRELPTNTGRNLDWLMTGWMEEEKREDNKVITENAAAPRQVGFITPPPTTTRVLLRTLGSRQCFRIQDRRFGEAKQAEICNRV